MAAFSYHHHIHQPFLLDSSIFLPNTTPQDHLSQYSSDPLLHEIQAEDDHSRAVESSSTADDHDPNSLPKKQTTPDSSTVVDNKLETGEQVTQKLTPLDKKKRKNTTATSSFSSAQSKDARERKGKKHKKLLMDSGGKKDEEIKKVKSTRKEEALKVGDEPPTGYIHVRARRGQATDSHSLAERVRREKISERMKMLQRLVPGCDKVTGRAVMLDEIINYVQSLQNQVEFLSMKLASVNPLFYEFGMEVGALMVKPEVNVDTSSHIITTTTTAAATTFSSVSNYPYLDSAASLLLQQGQSPNPFSQQDSESLLWDVEDQRQNFLNPSGFNNNLCSFN